jgi:signal transduction histidine kinase
MKLVQKFTIALIAGTSLVLSANGYFRVRRDVARFQIDRVRDHELLGLALNAAFAAVFRAEGPARADEMLAQASAREPKIAIRRVATAPDGFLLSQDAVGEPASRVATEDGKAVRETYVPSTGRGDPPGGLLISEALAAERSFVRTTIVDTVVTTVLLGMLSAAIFALVGGWFVGRPVQSLMDKARRVGRRDFTGPLVLDQADELGALAHEMNVMCDRLVEAERRSEAAAAARIAALEQLRHADRLMTVGKLASGIAHELGTPLNVVGARAAMIADGETSPPESAEYARIIVDACDQMTRIIRQLLDFARPRGPERATEDLRPIVARTLDLLDPMASKRGVSLAATDDGGAAVAEVDAGQIQQVITNLVANAIQAMERPGRVQVDVSRGEATPPPEVGGEARPCVCLQVRDDGTGIGPDHLAHVFEPFFTTKDVGQGTGLGLSVAYGIVREHGGWMSVTSVLGEGSTFAVYLPARGSAS